MEEGVLVAWLVEEGETVAPGDVIAQVETDKATMDMEAYDDGVLLKRLVEEGDSVPIGAPIAILGKEGEDISGLLDGNGGDGASTAAPAVREESADEAPTAEAAPEPSGDGAATPAPSASSGGRLKASPLARRLAKEHGIDLGQVQGSGPEGRIIKRDIEAFRKDEPASQPSAPAQPAEAPAARQPDRAPAPATPAPAAAEGTYDAVRISQMRKTIARRLGESKYSAPHFYLTMDVDMTKATTFRQQLNELAQAQDRGKVSFNDLITKACALALRQHPWVNASWMEQEGEIRLHQAVHVAIAVAIDEGLVTPVIRNADQKGLGQIAAETRDLAKRARDRELQPEDWSGSTFSTSNLGMFGIEEFTAIINPPNACILAIGAIRDVPVVKDGDVVPGKQMKITLSCDHRVVDGATGAQFLATVRQYLEDPLNLLL